MALGILEIIFILITLLAILGQVFLYRKNDQWILWFNGLLGILISYLAYSSLPSNYVGLKALALVWGLFAIVAIPLGLKAGKMTILSKIMLTLSIAGGLIQLFI